VVLDEFQRRLWLRTFDADEACLETLQTEKDLSKEHRIFFTNPTLGKIARHMYSGAEENATGRGCCDYYGCFYLKTEERSPWFEPAVHEPVHAELE
jgi:hypothetical protein